MLSNCLPAMLPVLRSCGKSIPLPASKGVFVNAGHGVGSCAAPETVRRRALLYPELLLFRQPLLCRASSPNTTCLPLRRHELQQRCTPAMCSADSASLPRPPRPRKRCCDPRSQGRWCHGCHQRHHARRIRVGRVPPHPVSRAVHTPQPAHF